MANKWKVDVEFDFTKLDQLVAEHINDNAEQIAKQIAVDAKTDLRSREAKSLVKLSGNLAKGIRAVRSKFDDGGWIVISRAPHSHLVEFGTKKVRKSEDGKSLVAMGKDGKPIFFGPEVGPMPAKPFLRPALDKNITKARALFGAKD